MALESEYDLDCDLPFKDNNAIIAFSSNADGILSKRKISLQNRIFAVGDSSSPGAFVSTVADALFHKEYQQTHKFEDRK